MSGNYKINVSFLTNAKAPYRKLQFEELAKISDCKFTIYYTNPHPLDRNWSVDPINGVGEFALRGLRVSKKNGYINFGLRKIVKESDLLLIGGTEQPTYHLVARLCKRYGKKYVLIFDGVSPKKIDVVRRNYVKYKLKSKIINDASAIFGNGTVAIEYFTKAFGYPKEKIFNQYLTVNVERIMNFLSQKEELRKIYREKYAIPMDHEVIIYSGRLLKRKNVSLIVRALKSLDKAFLLILGDGEEKENILRLAESLRVPCKITGFIEDQDELFKSYYAGDLLVLPSYNEPWGLVVNESMAAGLPVVVSNECGCYFDLVKDGENGFVLTDLENPDMLRSLVLKVLAKKTEFSKKSLEMISDWIFDNSRRSFENLLTEVLADSL